MKLKTYSSFIAVLFSMVLLGLMGYVAYLIIKCIIWVFSLIL